MKIDCQLEVIRPPVGCAQQDKYRLTVGTCLVFEEFESQLCESQRMMVAEVLKAQATVMTRLSEGVRPKKSGK